MAMLWGLHILRVPAAQRSPLKESLLWGRRRPGCGQWLTASDNEAFHLARGGSPYTDTFFDCILFTG